MTSTEMLGTLRLATTYRHVHCQQGYCHGESRPTVATRCEGKLSMRAGAFAVVAGIQTVGHRALWCTTVGCEGDLLARIY